MHHIVFTVFLFSTYVNAQKYERESGLSYYEYLQSLKKKNDPDSIHRNLNQQPYEFKKTKREETEERRRTHKRKK